MNKYALRLTVVGAALGAALSANAYVLTITGDVTGNGVLTATTTQSNLSGLPNFVFTGSAPVTGSASSFTGSFLGSTNSISLQGAGFALSGGGTTSFAGTWTGTVSPALGIKNTGTYSGSYDNLGKFSIAVVGQPVPEPASMAILGLGALGLIRRRKA